MKPEYSFQKGERGKFFHREVKLQVPVYLEPEVLAFVSAEAEKKGIQVDRLVNDLLKREAGK